ncbi:hypothetical protein ACVKN3_001228 [Luteibacter sp. PvP120]
MRGAEGERPANFWFERTGQCSLDTFICVLESLQSLNELSAVLARLKDTPLT